MIFHYINPSGLILSRIPFGYGVDLFFVLSGFLITSILFKIKDDTVHSRFHDLKNFYVRRSLKIFPIYYLTLIFLTLIQFQNYKEVNPWVFTYTTNIWIALEKPYLGSYNHLWSLAVEEQFYLLWPVLILWASYKNIKPLIVLVIIASIIFKIGLYNYSGQWVPAINASPFGCMDSLGLGALLAYFLNFQKSFYEKFILNKWIFLGVFIIYFLAIMVPVFPETKWIPDIFSNTLFSLLAFFILAPAATDRYNGIVKRVLENKIIIHLGKISYGLYLYHFFMPDFFNYLNSIGLFLGNTDNFRVAFYFVACLLFSEISWFLIERPVLKLKNRFA